MANELPEAEKPHVTAETKFRRGGFKPAAEVIAEAEVNPAAAAAPEDQVMADAIAAEIGVTAGEGVSFEGNVEHAEVNPDEESPEAAAPAAREPKVKIGGREFGTQEEAWAYAEQLEQERLAADAFRQGVEAASRGNPVQSSPEPAAPAEIDPEYYTDPQAYWAKREAQIIQKAQAAVDTNLQRQESHRQTWTQFYNDYPDLGHARELVDLTLQQDWNMLQHVETKQALKQLAEKVRTKLKPYVDSQMPRVSLPRVATAASPGGSAQVTSQKTAPQALNFASQMKNLKKGKAQFR